MYCMVIYIMTDDYTNVIIRVPKSDLEKFDRLADSRRTNRSSLLRGMILDAINQNENDPGA